MGSEVCKVSESECFLKCESSWYLSQAATAPLPWPDKQEMKVAQPYHEYIGDARTQTYTHTKTSKISEDRYAFFYICKTCFVFFCLDSWKYLQATGIPSNPAFALTLRR